MMLLGMLLRPRVGRGGRLRNGAPQAAVGYEYFWQDEAGWRCFWHGTARSQGMTGTILWFKRDLRVADHPALARAAQIGAPVLPLYIVEPGLWAQSDADARHYGFLRESLVDLKDRLDRIGLALVIRVGEAVTVLEDLRARHAITRLISHEETGNGWTYARDRAVAAWARGQGVVWEEPAAIRRGAAFAGPRWLGRRAGPRHGGAGGCAGPRDDAGGCRLNARCRARRRWGWARMPRNASAAGAPQVWRVWTHS